MFALLLAAGVTILPASVKRQAPTTRTLDQRLSLMEAKQMLEAQQLWGLQAALPPKESLRALDDLELHLQRDQEQDDKVRELTAAVLQLQERLAALELAMPVHGAAEGGPIRVVPSAPLARSEEPAGAGRKLHGADASVRSRTAHKAAPGKGSAAAKVKARKGERNAESP